ncbi:MAG: COX15/CtaA family protein [Rhodospirillales bacterium]|nr:COX15/CtaA family protein [Alphaproteobacteria bacterium]MCB9986919.1 COX15/CtaA family protein [Rhodospirillales bacterium]USO08305.1 MAG: COX15/CtaA family protein [Rhodospirillales bacterium]
MVRHNTYIKDNDKALTLDKSTLSTDVLNANWLLVCAALSFAAVMIGAFPMDRTGFQVARFVFAPGALLRLWDGLTLLTVFLPLLLFWAAHGVARGYGAKYVGILALVGIQCAACWCATANPYTPLETCNFIHPVLAMLAGAMTFWMALTLLRRDGALVMRPVDSTPSLRTHGRVALALAGLLAALAAFRPVPNAVLNDAGWMNPDQWAEHPTVTNLLANPAMAQIIRHTPMLAVCAIVLGFAWRAQSPTLATAIVIQLGLGVLTVVSGATLPLAILYQAGALVTLAALLYELHRVLLGAGATTPAP